LRHASLLCALLAVGGCTKDEPTQSPICERYLACLAATSPPTFASALPLYGPEGDCWKSTVTAQSCETACRTELQGLAAAHPGVAECAAASDGGVPPGDGRADGRRPLPDWGPLPAAGEVDILFVIDNSNSMEQEQRVLNANFGALIDALRSPKLGGPGCSAATPMACKLPSLRIGVVSTDLGAGTYGLPSCEVAGGDGGKLQTQPRSAGCTPPKDPWIAYADGVTNIPGATGDPEQQVKAAFECIAHLGTGGCGFEHQLESARRALDPAQNVNPSFLRPGAYLAIVFLTDEDDCSAKKTGLFDPSQQGLTDPLGPLTSFRCFEFGIQCKEGGRQPGVRTGCVPGLDWLQRVEDYVTFFQSLKAPGRTFLAAIAGPTDLVEVGVEGGNPVLKPSCQSANGVAVPAIRIQSLVSAFGPRGLFNRGLDPAGKEVSLNICATDYTPALRLLGARINAVGP
jgi:hypothetical protein